LAAAWAALVWRTSLSRSSRCATKVLDIFRGQQHCCDVGKLRLFQRGLLRIHLRKRGTAVTNRQVHAAQSVRTTDSEWVCAPSVRALRPREPPMAKPGCRAARA
jgi:hypothetical protein